MREVIYTPPDLYAKQYDAIFAPARYALIEASTKSGKTFGCMDWLLQKAMKGKAGQNFWWVAPIFNQAAMVFNRYKATLPREVFTAHEGKLMIALGNATNLWFKSAENPDSLFGEDVYAVVIDEATRCREESWYAIRSTLTATQGDARIIGNVKGRKNWAYHLARRAEGGAANMHYAKITAYDAVEAGVLAASEIEDAQAGLPEHVFRELYLAEPSDDEGNPFGAQHIRACMAPVSNGAPVVWGWDLARKVDWTVGVALDAQGAVCQVERWQHVPWEETHRRILRCTEDRPALIDSSGVGDPPVERLQTAGANVQGYLFTAKSKQQLMEGLAIAIQHREITFPEGPITQELLSFEYAVTRTSVQYTAPEGLHDDCVMALALAVRHRRIVAGDAPALLVLGAPRTNGDAHGAAVKELEGIVMREGAYWPSNGR